MKNGWKVEPLGDVCDFRRGLTYAKGDEVDVSDNVVLRATNIDLTTNMLDLSELRYINDSVSVPDSKKVKKGSLMICTASGSKRHLGKVAFIDDDYGYAFGGFMGMITPKEALLPRYLFHLMTSRAYKDFIGELSDGANINNLKFDDLRKFLVPYPDRVEQRRIVAILDKTLEGVATAKAITDRNLQNARALFESYLHSVFAQPGAGWVKTTIGEYVRFIDYRGKTPKKTESGLRLITAKNVKMGHLQETPKEFVAPESYDGWMTRGIPRRGDVLFTTEAPLANVTQLDTDEKVVFAQRIIVMQPEASKLDSTFLKYLLLSQPVQRRIHAEGTGATATGIKASLLKKIEISFPKDLAAQSQIVAKLDSLADETERLESVYKQKLAALDALKKSMLHQAFAGKLGAHAA